MGLRQGDPLSPYLFVLCSEVLSVLLRTALIPGSLSSFKIDNGSTINHLIYADDCILFVKASLQEATVVKCLLHLYCCLSGLHINPQKSSIIFG